MIISSFSFHICSFDELINFYSELSSHSSPMLPFSWFTEPLTEPLREPLCDKDPIGEISFYVYESAPNRPN